MKTCHPDFTSSCDKHPYSSHVGICPLCLTHKLAKLVCSDCGKSRVSSCCCSSSSNRVSSSSVFDVGSVGRLSFFIDNEKNLDCNKSKTKSILLRRSSSTCVEQVKKKNGFWRLLFGKKTNKNGEAADHINGVSRSVSFSSSNAKIFSNAQFGCFSNQMEVHHHRVCNFPIIKASDDHEFIDLNLDSLSEDFVGGGDDGGGNGVSDIYGNGNSKIGGNFTSLKGKWGFMEKGVLAMNEVERGLKQGSKN